MLCPVLVVLSVLGAIASITALPAAACIIGDPNQSPTITITSVTPNPWPPWLVQGTVDNVDADLYDVVLYARTDKFYIEPSPGAHAAINCDGTFAQTSYGGEVHYALLVRKSWSAPSTMYYLPTFSQDVRAIACNPNRQYAFGGYGWWGKGTDGVMFDPGANYWSDDTQHVWQDTQGIHLKLSVTDGLWRSAEVYSKTAFPYGRIAFAVNGPICALDPRVVFGGFIYKTTSNEADIEMGMLGNNDYPNNAQYIVQPDGPGRKYRFACPPLDQTNHEMVWDHDIITFTSREGGVPGYGAIIATWSFAGTGIPQEADSMRCHFNLWTLDASGPGNHLPVEAILTAFSFTPIALVTVPDLVGNEIVLLRISPNPVRDRMHLSFNLPSDERVSLEMFDVQGRLVSHIADQQWFAAGMNHLDVQAPNAAGVYLLRLVVGNHVALCKVSVVP